MTGESLYRARKRKGLTQQRAARLLGVTQGYLSMLEQGTRRVPNHLLTRLRELYGLPPLALPLPESVPQMDESEMSRELGSAGYPGFSYMSTELNYNPAAVLVSALTRNELEPRVAESLPWLVFTYNNMDWDWVVREVKLNDATNRLGFVVTLAREVAGRKSESSVAQRLADLEAKLEHSKLAREDTFCHEEMTQAERRWLKDRRTPEAQRWNVLSDLSADHLSYAA